MARSWPSRRYTASPDHPMPVGDSHITLVFQGPVIHGPLGTADSIRVTRRALSHSRCVLSTWTGSATSGLGSTSTLHQYWSVPFMTETDARFYDDGQHAAHSTFLDRRFRSRLAVGQHLATHYVRQLGYSVPRYHNDIVQDVMAGHRSFLARHCLILDPWDVG